MRIAQVAPVVERVPPKFYGGTERVVSGLTEALVRRGHDVVLFASGDSVTSAKLIAACHDGLRLDPRGPDPLTYSIIELGKVVARADEFDVVHNHLDYLAFPALRRIDRPAVTTLHGRLDLPNLPELYSEFSDVSLASISYAQRHPLPAARWVANVYNGIDLSHFSFRESQGTYLAFLGRISPEKRVDRAVAIARAVGMPLRVAAKVDPVDREYFRQQIRPLFNDRDVEFIGEIDERHKDEFLGQAYAYLFPIDWPEPFGMTMIEAMACGTPVVAMGHGSVPEVVIHGQTGFICHSVADMVAAVPRVAQLRRQSCRAHVALHFSIQQMADGYERLYRHLIREHDATNRSLRFAGAAGQDWKTRNGAKQFPARSNRVAGRVTVSRFRAKPLAARSGEPTGGKEG
jgi:glycosyltransferase involved in cell wall biosynthesis